MPITVARLRALPEAPVREGSIASRALAHLRARPGMAFTPKEVAEALDVAQTTLSPQLTRLRRRGLVGHEKGHWYALDDDEVAKALAMRMATRSANVRLRPENPQEWIDTPQD